MRLPNPTSGWPPSSDSRFRGCSAFCRFLAILRGSACKQSPRFFVIIGTIVIYGLTASPLAQWLGLAEPHPQGLLIVGAHSWAREMASLLDSNGFRVILVDSNWAKISAARSAGLKTYYGNILSHHAQDEVDLDGIGRLLALTPNDEVNSLAVLHFVDAFGRSEVSQLPAKEDVSGPRNSVTPRLRGHLLFDQEATFEQIREIFDNGGEFELIRLDEEPTEDRPEEIFGKNSVPLFVIDKDGKMEPVTVELQKDFRAGQRIVSLVGSFTDSGSDATASAESDSGRGEGD